MDAAGIDISIVSLTCPNVYWGNEDVSCRAARESNDTMAEAQTNIRTASAGSLRCLGNIRKRAVEELKRTCDNGAIGVMVLANVSGSSLTDPFFRADLGGDRSPRACRCWCIRPTRPASI